MIKKFFLFPKLLTLTSSSAFAQGPPSPWGPPMDNPDMVPIDHWLPVFFALAVLFAFNWFRRQLSKPKHIIGI